MRRRSGFRHCEGWFLTRLRVVTRLRVGRVGRHLGLASDLPYYFAHYSVERGMRSLPYEWYTYYVRDTRRGAWASRRRKFCPRLVLGSSSFVRGAVVVRSCFRRGSAVALPWPCRGSRPHVQRVLSMPRRLGKR